MVLGSGMPAFVRPPTREDVEWMPGIQPLTIKTEPKQTATNPTTGSVHLDPFPAGTDSCAYAVSHAYENLACNVCQSRRTRAGAET